MSIVESQSESNSLQSRFNSLREQRNKLEEVRNNLKTNKQTGAADDLKTRDALTEAIVKLTLEADNLKAPSV